MPKDAHQHRVLPPNAQKFREECELRLDPAQKRRVPLRGGWRPNQATPQQADQDRGLFLETGEAAGHY
jgi:hypothetical protein